jgi:pimeloyl-ACP methyl ester carboxylesterase
MQADKNGLLPGDRIVSVNGEAVSGPLSELLRKGEGRKVIAWQHGDATRTAVFAWEPPKEGTREPEAVTLHAQDGVTLQADYFMGSLEGPASGGALVLLHMNRSDRTSWAPIRGALGKAGIATLALDLRGMGQSVDEGGTLAARVQAGDPELYNAMDQDAAAAVAWLESRAYPPQRIGLMGASVGCSVALRTASQDGRLAGVAALSPGTDYLGVDSLLDVARWDLRPLLLVNGQDEEEHTGSCAALRDAALAHDRWTPVQLILLPEPDVHGTKMFGTSPAIEQRLTDWWAARLR